jgi:transcriptional regulator with XRE-family HTH domain
MFMLAFEEDPTMPRDTTDDERANGNIEHGIRLANFRKAAGLSQYELASRVGVAQPVISRYEKGIRKLYDDMLADLAAALEVTPNDILGITSSKTRDAEAANLSKRMVARLKKIELLPRRAQDHLIAMIDMALKGATNSKAS